MKIGLFDVDGHNYPNLALMKISAWHKARGDTVEWWWSDLVHYDIVYMSKVFSDTYTPDHTEPLNADQVIKGGTGYAITPEGGREVYHQERDKPEEPYFTLEFDEKELEVRQNRGLRNCARTPEVEAFEEAWLAWVKTTMKKARVRVA